MEDICIAFNAEWWRLSEKCRLAEHFRMGVRPIALNGPESMGMRLNFSVRTCPDFLLRYSHFQIVGRISYSSLCLPLFLSSFMCRGGDLRRDMGETALARVQMVRPLPRAGKSENAFRAEPNHIFAYPFQIQKQGMIKYVSGPVSDPCRWREFDLIPIKRCAGQCLARSECSRFSSDT
jgi:hypothetical protein